MGVPRKYKIIHLAENFYPIVISLNEIFSPSLEFIHSSSPSSQENIKLGGSSSSDVPHFIDVLLNNNQSLPENIKRTLKVIRFEKDSEVKYGFRCDSTSLNFGTPSLLPPPLSLSSFPPFPLSSFLFSFLPSLSLSLLPSLSFLFLPFIFLSLSLSPFSLNLLFLPSLFPPSLYLPLLLPLPTSFLTQSPFLPSLFPPSLSLPLPLPTSFLTQSPFSSLSLSSFPLSSSSSPFPYLLPHSISFFFLPFIFLFLPSSFPPLISPSLFSLLSLSLPLFPLSSIPPNFVTQSNIFHYLPTYYYISLILSYPLPP